MEKIIIIGGGVAGLTCLNALLDKNISPLLLEGGEIGSPKMCGEFLAPQAVSILQNWNIGPIQPIQEARFYAKNTKFSFDFPHLAGAMSRSTAETGLQQRALKMQGRIRENALIKKIIPATAQSPYTFCLDNEEEIQAKTAIFATGKFGNTSHSLPLPYYGIKLHFPHVLVPSTLLMHSVKGAYFGIVPITHAISNFACLATKSTIEKIGSCNDFFNRLVETNVSLQNIFSHIDAAQITWFESRAPDFTLKKIPSWPRAFWIGDALAGLYPAIGSGFSYAINSAILAATCYIQQNSNEYLKKVRRVIRPKLFLGKLMNHIMINPNFASVVFPLLQSNSWLLQTCLKQLEYRN